MLGVAGTNFVEDALLLKVFASVHPHGLEHAESGRAVEAREPLQERPIDELRRCVSDTQLTEAWISSDGCRPNADRSAALHRSYDQSRVCRIVRCRS